MHASQKIIESFKGICFLIELESTAEVPQFEEFSADYFRFVNVHLVIYWLGLDYQVEVLNCVNQRLKWLWTAISLVTKCNQIHSDNREGPESLEYNV